MLIVGCGYTGRRLARESSVDADRIRGLVRSPESAVALQAMGVQALRMDLDQPAPESLRDERIWYLAPPPAQGRSDPRVQNFLHALQAGPSTRMVYLSTTGVYGDCAGAWVDETRSPAPVAERARRRWDAEQQLRAWRDGTGAQLVVLRVAGIYGPERLPVERLRKGLPMVSAQDAPWTNRIQVDDLVQVLKAAMQRGRDGEVYNVSDGHPGNMADYFNRVADQMGLSRPPQIALQDASGQLSPGLLSYLAESRRLDNTKMLSELGVKLRYPSLDEGLPASVGGG